MALSSNFRSTLGLSAALVFLGYLMPARIGAERIGWSKFFEIAEIPFEKEHIDDFKHAGLTYKTSTHLTF